MNRYKGANVLLLGATGFIGRWVGHELQMRGAFLHMLARDVERTRATARESGFRGRIVHCDLSDLPQVAAQVRAVQPDIVFNLASYGVNRRDRDESIAQVINADVLATLCEALTHVPPGSWAGERLVHVGSALEYGDVTGNLAEDGGENPVSLYGRTKWAGTRNVQRFGSECGLRGVTARLFMVYGPSERAERLLPSLLRAADTAGPIPLTAGVQRRDFTFVHDVVEGLLRLGVAQAAPGAVVNLASGRLHSVREFVETAADILLIPRERLAFGALPTREDEMWHEPVSIERLRATTGWTPQTDIAEGIRRSIVPSSLVASA